ncbi:beta-xylosidase [Allocatelliglobosispora scoriae]|uniref:Beta-xylosidase n=1 Tax=Allocatelliglobosispora scoriae TaxID=643052 RepID=A0A841C5M7_9ACTN|nr:hypothetical protein [Allocatelliglobosispora scoriae]MBB5874250.1 beta-xylosidase [Allocatelliglobosispora scoriae]
MLSCDRGRLSRVGGLVAIPDGPIRLRLDVDGDRLGFAFGSAAEGPLTAWSSFLDAGILSDDHAAEERDGVPQLWGFTGAFLGLWAQDLTEGRAFVDVDSATYRER